jgi:zinc finger protein
MIANQNVPMEYTFKVKSKKDLNVRVIKSSTGTIELPELGIIIEPGSFSEAFVTNIEGIFVRAAEVIKQADRFSDNESKKEIAEKLLKRIEKIREGNGEATIIIKDPMGNSSIVSDNAIKRELTPEEIKSLETGIVIFDLAGEKKNNK